MKCETRQHFAVSLSPTLPISCVHVMGRLIFTQIWSQLSKRLKAAIPNLRTCG